MMPVWIGWDPAEMAAWNVAARSAGVPAHRLALSPLQKAGLYTRAMEHRTADGRSYLWDVRSDAPMSTEHALSRFWVPMLCEYHGWALFTDGDVLFRGDIQELFALADPKYAVQVVQHAPLLAEGTKKDGQPQTAYHRKNWSSVILWNCGHPANQALTLDVLNTWPGRDLHAFKWLTNDLIGQLPAQYNYLVNVSPMPEDVKIAHFTLGTPNLPGHAEDPFADEWLATAKRAGYRFNLAQASNF